MALSNVLTLRGRRRRRLEGRPELIRPYNSFTGYFAGL
jgi:hypothetical protein